MLLIIEFALSANSCDYSGRTSCPPRVSAPYRMYGGSKHYASVLHGAMPPYCRELCLRTVGSYPSILRGAMPPYCMELCLHTVGSYPSILSGAMPPYCRELCLRTVGSYASILSGAMPPYCAELSLRPAWRDTVFLSFTV